MRLERDTLVDESGLVREAEVREAVLYYLNLDRRLATQVSTTISLRRQESCHRNDEDIPLEDSDKDDLSVISKPTESQEKRSVDSILKEKNVITLVHKLKLVLSKMSYEEVSSLLKKHRRSARLAYLMEAAGSSGAHHVFKAVQKIFPFQQKQHSGLVGKCGMPMEQIFVRVLNFIVCKTLTLLLLTFMVKYSKNRNLQRCQN